MNGKWINEDAPDDEWYQKLLNEFIGKGQSIEFWLKDQ